MPSATLSSALQVIRQGMMVVFH